MFYPMGVEIEIFVAIVLLLLLLIIIAGFVCYLFRNYCLKKQKARAGYSESKTDDRSYKTTTDSDERQTNTFEQILKNEERSNYRPELTIHQVKLQP